MSKKNPIPKSTVPTTSRPDDAALAERILAHLLECVELRSQLLARHQAVCSIAERTPSPEELGAMLCVSERIQ